MLHGGPGAGCNEDHRRQWDPERYDVLLFDQRGCGRSTPFASLEANTTWDLVADIERLRAMCGHDKWQVFGGSWGSTLALAYAQSHPERVSELVLRGIFLCEQNELDWLYRYGASELYPEEWDDFVGHANERGGGADLLSTYSALLDDADPAVRRAAARAWNRWEGVTVTLLPEADTIDHMAEGDNSVATARIETHFFRHKCWLEPGQLLRGAGGLSGIPGVIVQGRHDCCTPPAAAWKLKKAWPEAELQIVPDGGHLFTEPGITDGLVRATDRFAKSQS
jgi:proline iminopeptidase